MEQVGYIILGWLFGLLSPEIISKIGDKYKKTSLFNAITSELVDLKYRMAVTNFLLAQKYGEIDKEYLGWIKPHLEGYEGNEPSQNILSLVTAMLGSNEGQLNGLVEHMRGEENRGLSLKTHSVSFLNSHIGNMSIFSLQLQTLIHEFLNHVNVINQDVEIANDSLKMTFDSSISNENHERLVVDLNNRYKYLQSAYKIAIGKIDNVIKYRI